MNEDNVLKEEEVIVTTANAPDEDDISLDAEQTSSGLDTEFSVEENNETDEANKADDSSHYEELMRSDLLELKREFPELGRISSITELSNPLRYAALRDMGLSATEAYLATAGKRRARDNRAHLSGSAPRPAGSPSYGMSRQELENAREIFGGMSDSEIQSLYRKVTR